LEEGFVSNIYGVKKGFVMLETILDMAKDPWVIVGFTGQIFFSLRFIVQWIASERRKESVVPVYFWYFSILGSSILLSYAIHRRDPVFIAGQACGLGIYVRNLMFIYRKKKSEK